MIEMGLFSPFFPSPQFIPDADTYALTDITEHQEWCSESMRRANFCLKGMWVPFLLLCSYLPLIDIRTAPAKHFL